MKENVNWKSFTVTDQATKTSKVIYYRQQKAIYGMDACMHAYMLHLTTYRNICTYKQFTLIKAMKLRNLIGKILTG